MQVIRNPDQNTTDLQKALELVLKIDPNVDRILVLGGLGGSTSHTFANINTLLLYSEQDIVLVGRDNIAFLVRPGITKIKSLHSSNDIGQVKCSLIPLMGAAKNVTTQGLKWNLGTL